MPQRKEDTRDLFIRSPMEEFKAFSRHRIELLEKFKEVEKIRKYMDAFELGMTRLNEALSRSAPRREVEGVAADGRPAEEAPPAVSGPGKPVEESMQPGGAGQEAGSPPPPAESGGPKAGEEDGRQRQE